MKNSKSSRTTLTGRAPKAQPAPRNFFPIVGIGASAGGLEAMTQLLKHLPACTGMAFVLVQHLDPTHESALTSLLSRLTEMPVSEARNDLRLRPNEVFVIPPNKLMGLAGRRLKLSPRRDADAQLSVDHFFRTLAEEEGNRAIGLILSGNGADGTQGLQAIKAAGGITFGQEERTAKFPAMPGNAITAGCVDFVLSPEKIARELNRIAGHPYVGPADEETAGREQPAEEKVFNDILLLLRQRTAVDFTHYKRATLHRRIQRRMLVHKLESLKEYSDYLRSHPSEVTALFSDILIHVTGFFRDADVFQALKKKIFPRLVKGKGADDPVRIWVPGCSTGEEVYSIAIALMEFLTDRKRHHPVQIFGTDIHETALEKARAGVYPEAIRADLSKDRLRLFFVKYAGGYRINKEIRAVCIFARQNVVVDPPFSNLDLISCRNVLIYLGQPLHRKVIPLFHYALKSNGSLMLGASETVGGFSDLFALTDMKAKLYAKKSTNLRRTVTFGPAFAEPQVRGEEGAAATTLVGPSLADVLKQAERILLTHCAPAGVIINQQMDVLQFRGQTGLFLEHAHGEASLNLLKMAREDLALDLRTVISKAFKQNARVRQSGARVQQNGNSLEVALEVIPFGVPSLPEKFYLVLFQSSLAPEAAAEKKLRGSKTHAHPTAERAELKALEQELASTRESLQVIIEEQEAGNEELRSANEEIMSSNEELQSTNEELETAKEELQSTNEELTTLNDELESRNAELERVNNDLHNVLSSVNIPIVILGEDLRIRRVTSGAERLFNLIPGDVGRPITDINLALHIPDLPKLVIEVIETLSTKEVEVQDRADRWHSLRIRPYRTTDDKIDGAVLALVDIDLIKKIAEQVAEARAFTEALINTMRPPVLVLDKDLIVQAASQAFYQNFQVTAQATLQRPIYKLGDGQWDLPRLRMLLEEILPENSSLDNFVVEHNFPAIGLKKMKLDARRFAVKGSDNHMILLTIEDITEAPAPSAASGKDESLKL